MAKMLDGMEALLRSAIDDAAMGWAYMTTLGEGESYTTVEMKVNFLRAVRTGRIAARALVKNAGLTLGLIECDVLDADGSWSRMP